MNNQFTEEQKLYLKCKKDILQHLLNFPKEDFKFFLSGIIEDINQNKKYLEDENIYQLLYDWLDYEILFKDHTISFIENIDFFIPNINVMENNLFSLIRNIFTIKTIIENEVKDESLKIKYLDILNKKVYENKEIIQEYMEITHLEAKTYWKIRNKAEEINENIEVVQLSQMLYRKEDIENFSGSIKLIN